jgi:hypothetical protein
VIEGSASPSRQIKQPFQHAPWSTPDPLYPFVDQRHHQCALLAPQHLALRASSHLERQRDRGDIARRHPDRLIRMKNFGGYYLDSLRTSQPHLPTADPVAEKYSSGYRFVK